MRGISQVLNVATNLIEIVSYGTCPGTNADPTASILLNHGDCTLTGIAVDMLPAFNQTVRAQELVVKCSICSHT